MILIVGYINLCAFVTELRYTEQFILREITFICRFW